MQLRRRIELSYSGHRRVARAASVVILAGIGVTALTGLALANSLSVAKQVKVDTKLENVVVNSTGVTVYTLSGETAHHLKCTKANSCFTFWFPVTVPAGKKRLTAAHGIKGKLGTLRRDGFRQITLAGHPLYTFIGDAGQKRRATGEGVVSFGGTWHVVATSSPSSPKTSGSTPTTPTTTTRTPATPYYP